jgi:hypothetical protein
MSQIMVEPPAESTLASELQTLEAVSRTELPEAVAAGQASMRLTQIADSLVWAFSDTADSMVPATVRDIDAAIRGAGGTPIDRVRLTGEVQCLIAWRSRSIIEAVTGLADGGQLGAEFRRWYAHRLRRLQCKLPSTRFIDARLDDYTRITTGEDYVFSWAAALFSALVVAPGSGLPAVHAAQHAAVGRLVVGYCNGVITYTGLLANAKG